MHQSGGKIKPIIRQILPYFRIIQPFQILIGGFQNTEEKFYSWIFEMILRLLSLLNSSTTGVKSFIICEKD